VSDPIRPEDRHGHVVRLLLAVVGTVFAYMLAATLLAGLLESLQ
jgi:hypothetical protein